MSTKLKTIARSHGTSLRCGVLAGGNWIVDRVITIDAYPPPEQVGYVLDQSTGTGGAPYNVLVNLARLGVDFPLTGAGLLGQDREGEAILQDCRQHKIDTRCLRTHAHALTAFTKVMSVQKTGQRTFFHFRGANALWKAQDLDFEKTKARIFHLGYLLLLDALDQPDPRCGTRAAALLHQAQEAGLKTSVDVISENSERFARVVVPALKFTDFCILNEFEAGWATGFKIRQPDGHLDPVALRHAAGALLQMGVRELVVIHYPEGGFARTRKGDDAWQPALKVPAKALAGTVGAGDAFAAGVLLGLHENWDLSRCLLTGACVAASSLGHPTATAGVKPLPACQALARKYGFQPALEPRD
ncbi:MAG TPA: carbohydrate kinase family protein [Candidatus Paceibacterota bacterium]|nr:carbohydrate kinase family protein [Verrucomicrobiota bacterium]HRY48812.1 carbohydrate kinase family protein [Candidatus Paceibacterota bacterium]